MADRDGDRVPRMLVEASLRNLHLRREHAGDLRLVGRALLEREADVLRAEIDAFLSNIRAA